MQRRLDDLKSVVVDFETILKGASFVSVDSRKRIETQLTSQLDRAVRSNIEMEDKKDEELEEEQEEEEDEGVIIFSSHVPSTMASKLVPIKYKEEYGLLSGLEKSENLKVVNRSSLAQQVDESNEELLGLNIELGLYEKGEEMSVECEEKEEVIVSLFSKDVIESRRKPKRERPTKKAATREELRALAIDSGVLEEKARKRLRCMESDDVCSYLPGEGWTVPHPNEAPPSPENWNPKREQKRERGKRYLFGRPEVELPKRQAKRHPGLVRKMKNEAPSMIEIKSDEQVDGEWKKSKRATNSEAKNKDAEEKKMGKDVEKILIDEVAKTKTKKSKLPKNFALLL